jgi:hypothetical protein
VLVRRWTFTQRRHAVSQDVLCHLYPQAYTPGTNALGVNRNFKGADGRQKLPHKVQGASSCQASSWVLVLRPILLLKSMAEMNKDSRGPARQHGHYLFFSGVSLVANFLSFKNHPKVMEQES